MYCLRIALGINHKFIIRQVPQDVKANKFDIQFILDNILAHRDIPNEIIRVHTGRCIAASAEHLHVRGQIHTPLGDCIRHITTIVIFNTFCCFLMIVLMCITRGEVLQIYEELGIFCWIAYKCFCLLTLLGA